MSWLSFLNMIGIHSTWQTYVQLFIIGGGVASYTILKTSEEMKKKTFEKMAEENKRIETEKKYLANKDWSKETEEEKLKVEQEYEALKIQKKVDEIEAANIAIEKCNMKKPYKGIVAPDKKALLLGYTKNGEPVWGLETNYIIAGTTRRGKTRKLHAMLLNFLANKQGDVYIVDLKGIDYTLYDGINHVKCRVTDLKNVSEAVFAFKAEYERRQQIIAEGYTDESGIKRAYLDIEDYNTRNPKTPLKDFMLLVDEFADISDTYSKDGKPIGCYEVIIEMARKCAAMGGRIVMGTQRPDRNVIIGTLKNNCSLIGLGCLNEINSKIVIDTGGCEKLAKTEALAYVDTKLTKIFAYTISNQKLIEYTDRLKGIKIGPINEPTNN